MFDLATFKFTKTINVGKLVYKLLPLDPDYLLCAGSYLLELLRLADHRMVEVCKLETSVYDSALVSEIGQYCDYALATWEGLQFVRVDRSQQPYSLEILPLRVREKEAINNVARVRENVVAFADGSQLVVYDRLLDQELVTMWCESQIRSIKSINAIEGLSRYGGTEGLYRGRRLP